MESAPGCDFYKVMIGIGINLNTLNCHYTGLKQASSVLIETGIRIPISALADSLAKNIVLFFKRLRDQGFKGDIYKFI
jgi:biotin-(acetyl-CoA carboxylase) ligase